MGRNGGERPTRQIRLWRGSEVRAKAIETLGSPQRADGWLAMPNRALGGVTPMSLIDTDTGAQAVLDVLGRIDYGVFS